MIQYNNSGHLIFEVLYLFIALDGEVKVDARKELKYIISPGYHTFDAAQQFCASKGWDLPAFNDSELYHQAVKIMEKEDLKSMWMGMKKITYDRFKWVDGTGKLYLRNF